MDISGLQKETVMPVTSSKQFKFMALVRSGKKKVKGLSPDKAKEFMDSTPASKRSEFMKAKR